MGVRKYVKQSDRARAALLLARENHQVSELAEIFGCRRATISKFINGGRVRNALVQKIEDWTREQGYWIWDGFAEATNYPADLVRRAREKYPTPDAIWSGLAGELRTLADTLESPAFDRQTKILRVKAHVEFLTEVIEQAVIVGKQRDQGET